MTIRLLVTVYFMFISSLLHGQEADPLFASAELLDITLNGPFAQIDRERDKEQSYDGSLSYLDQTGEAVKLDAKFEVRGNWRLQRSNCGHAQLWVDLRRGQTSGTLFENQNRLKLVVQCGRQERHQQWIVKEQLAYDLFAHVSDLNFDTRLLSVRYVDSEKTDTERTENGFFIEHQNRLADRFSMEKVELNRVNNSELDPMQANAVALFMYMIGNTDFSLAQGAPDDECCHNAKLLQNDEGSYFAFPYDFDSSGFVDTSYAAPPNESIGIRSNKQRRFRGYCSHQESLPDSIELLKQSIQGVTETLESSTHLTSRTRRSVDRYMEEFFEVIADERKLRREILEDCR